MSSKLHLLPIPFIRANWLYLRRYWDFRDDLKIYETIPVDKPLPSDCRYREDVKMLADGDMDGASE